MTASRRLPVSAVLRLVPMDDCMAVAFSRGPGELEACLGARVPDGWPRFPAAFAATRVRSDGWGNYVLLTPDGGRVLGNGGFKGPPNAAGTVEIGYEVAPSFRRMGFATAAARAFVAWAASDGRVSEVRAHTLLHDAASQGVLRRAGFIHNGTLDHPSLGTTRQWSFTTGDATRF